MGKFIRNKKKTILRYKKIGCGGIILYLKRLNCLVLEKMLNNFYWIEIEAGNYLKIFDNFFGN
jgi:hypothetical protein